MEYYCIGYLYGEPEKKGCFALFEHLPCTWQVTNDKEEALEWFDAAVKSACKCWNGNELLYVRDEKLDYRCIIKQARFVCNEPAYKKGEYIIELISKFDWNRINTKGENKQRILRMMRDYQDLDTNLFRGWDLNEDNICNVKMQAKLAGFILTIRKSLDCFERNNKQ